MKRIKIYVLHPYAHDVKSALEYMQIENLEKYFEFEWEPFSPDYLITTELIYNIPKIREEYKRLHAKASVTIFFTREAVSPDFNLCDYAVGFDSDLSKGDRFVQLPTAFDLYPLFNKVKKNRIDTISGAMEELKRKQRFCNFLYSNHLAHPNRDKLYHLLSQYKKIDSLGRHLNNMHHSGTGYKGYESDSVKIKSNYKFSIAAENASFSGYTSEKIITSLAAHTIPIYFGDPKVTDIINPKCFINCNELEKLEDVVEIIRKIDNDDDLWCQIINEPWQTDEQISLSNKRNADYINFFYNIFSENISNAKRRPEGCRPDMYSYQFFSERIHKRPIFIRAYNRIVKSYLRK